MFEILEYSNKIKELYIGKDTINKIIEAYKKSIIENEESIKKIYDINLLNKNTPSKNRSDEKFYYYYDILWKEIDK